MEGRRSIVGAMISDNNLVAAPTVIAPEKAEPKSQRVNLLVRPSLYAAVKDKCGDLGISVNEAVNQLLEKWVEV